MTSLAAHSFIFQYNEAYSGAGFLLVGCPLVWWYRQDLAVYLYEV